MVSIAVMPYISYPLCSRFIFVHRHAMVLSLALSASALVWWRVDFIPYLVIEDSVYFSTICIFLGTLLLLSGIVLRIWSGLYIGGHKNLSLVADGPYRLTRNPLYMGNMISALGVMIFTQSLTATLFLHVSLSVVYRMTIVHEEQKLLALFDDAYRRYLSTTPRFVPYSKEVSALLGSGAERMESISYRNLSRELGRGGVFLATGMAVLVLTHALG